MSKNKLVVKKVDLESFIEILTELWEKGIDFVDIHVGEDDKKISLSFIEEYLSEEAKNHLKDEMNELPPTDIKDLNIDDLI